jgi:hypothetical protein
MMFSCIRPRHLLLLGLVLLVTSPAAGQSPADTAPPLPRVFLQVDSIDTAAAAINGSGDLARRVGVRAEGSLASSDARLSLDRRLRAISAPMPALWLTVDTPATQAAVDDWRRHLRSILAAARPSVLELRLASQSPQLVRFIVQAAAADAGGAGLVRVALGGDLSLGTVLTSAVAPYVDAVVVEDERAAERAARHLAKVDPESLVLMTSADVSADPVRAVIDGLLRTVGSGVSAASWRMDAGSVPAAIKGLASIDRVMSGEISELDPAISRLRLSIAGEDVTSRLPHRLLFDNTSLATLLVYWGEERKEPLRVDVTVPVEGTPAVLDVVTGARLRAAQYRRDANTSLATAELPLTGRPMLVDFNEEATEVFADRTGVSAIRQLTVEEIIARHRQQQARQDAAIDRYTARVRLQQHFRPTVTDPGYDVVTENRYFVDREGVEWEELSFSVNGSRWGADRPPFPLLQPEKVLSLPLQLRFDEDYRYTLQGTGTTDGYECYLIDFEPVRAGQSLYRGTLWIDAKTFARVRVRAVQTGLSAPVVSNEEVQVYRPVPVNGTAAFLLSTLTAHQIILIAGRNLLLEKVATFESFDINPAGFEEERARARSSDAIMYRETDRGLRYFVKEGEARVVSERATTSAKAAAIGVTIDPSYDFPLPILGINYLDFEFRNPETQLAVLFAGVLAAGNIQRPKIGNTPLDASVDFFAIAVPSNERLYEEGGENPSEALLTWPLTAGLNLGWQFTPFQKAGAQYQFRFDGYIRDRETAESYVPPPSTTTHGIGVSWEYRRGGYSVVLNGLWNKRLGWRPWGDPLNPETSKATYARYTVSVARDFVLGPFQKIHVDGAWFGGEDLDRLSRYQFGLFEATRIHGVPSSGLRFDDILMARGAYSFNIFDQYRLDLFLDQAWGRDRTFGDDRQPITGIGAAINFRTPWWGTLLRADVGKAFLPARYDGVGSTVVQVMLQKPLR